MRKLLASSFDCNVRTDTFGFFHVGWLHGLLPIPNGLLWFCGKLFVGAVLFIDECLMSSDVGVHTIMFACGLFQ